MSNVVSVFGGPTGERAVNAALVECLERWLEMARSGEAIGMAGALLHCDGLASYSVAGSVGGYGMIGALEVARLELVEIAR